jgi:hypothetical protein
MAATWRSPRRCGRRTPPSSRRWIASYGAAGQGVFRADIDAVDLHMMISAFCFFRVSNRHTFGILFGCDLTTPQTREKHKRMIGNAIIRLLESGEAAPTDVTSLEPVAPHCVG